MSVFKDFLWQNKKLRYLKICFINDIERILSVEKPAKKNKTTWKACIYCQYQGCICLCLPPDRTWHKVNDWKVCLKWGLEEGTGGQEWGLEPCWTLLLIGSFSAMWAWWAQLEMESGTNAWLYLNWKTKVPCYTCWSMTTLPNLIITLVPFKVPSPCYDTKLHQMVRLHNMESLFITISLKSNLTQNGCSFGLVLWHINHCWLFNAKSYLLNIGFVNIVKWSNSFISHNSI